MSWSANILCSSASANGAVCSIMRCLRNIRACIFERRTDVTEQVLFTQNLSCEPEIILMKVFCFYQQSSTREWTSELPVYKNQWLQFDGIDKATKLSVFPYTRVSAYLCSLQYLALFTTGWTQLSWVVIDMFSQGSLTGENVECNNLEWNLLARPAVIKV